jgi:hypothetical protein
MTGSIRSAHVRTLCILAQADESSLQFPLPDNIYGFHAQQSCEKLFKALLAANGIVYPFTHRLETLAKLLETCGEILPFTPYDPIDLDPYAVELRYDMGDPLSSSDRVTIRQSVAILRESILNRILELEQLQTP